MSVAAHQRGPNQLVTTVDALGPCPQGEGAPRPTGSPCCNDIPIVRPELLSLQLFAVCSFERAERLTDRLWSDRLLSGPSLQRFLDQYGSVRGGTAPPAPGVPGRARSRLCAPGLGAGESVHGAHGRGRHPDAPSGRLGRRALDRRRWRRGGVPRPAPSPRAGSSGLEPDAPRRPSTQRRRPPRRRRGAAPNVWPPLAPIRGSMPAERTPRLARPRHPARCAGCSNPRLDPAAAFNRAIGPERSGHVGRDADAFERR